MVKNCHCQKVLKKAKLPFFVFLAAAHSISISVSPTKGSCFIIKKKKIKPRKQSLKQHKTGPRYSSAHVIDLELKTYENNI